MAKVSGPLFSMDASGQFAGALVFSKFKGRNTVRQLVTPSNPQTADQETARNKMRVSAAAQKFVNRTATKGSGRTDLDETLLRAAAPAGQTWNAYLTTCMIGSGAANYTAAGTAWGALAAGAKTAWGTAAAALTPAIAAVAQTSAGGASATAIDAGEVFFRQQYGLYVAGILTSAPGATPPTYA